MYMFLLGVVTVILVWWYAYEHQCPKCRSVSMKKRTSATGRDNGNEWISEVRSCSECGFSQERVISLKSDCEWRDVDPRS